MYVNVIPGIRCIRGVDSFTYSTDQEVQIGQVVWIPWRSKTVFGVVSQLHIAEPDFPTRSISSITDTVVPAGYVQFLQWLAQHYGISESHAVKLCVPEPLKRSSRYNYEAPHHLAVAVEPATVEPLQQVVQELDSTDVPVHNVAYGSFSQAVGVLLGIHKTAKDSAGPLVVIVPEERLVVHYSRALSSLKPLTFTGHSSKGQRNAVLHVLLDTKPEIVIGTKLLSLLPLQNCAKVIVVDPVDESHKQWEANPRYHAWTTAVQQATESDVQLVGLHQAPALRPHVSTVDTRLADAVQRTVRVVDMAEEFKSEFGGLLSTGVWERVQQANCPVLWFNRKGRGRYTICQDCRAFVGGTDAPSCTNCQSQRLEVRGFGTGSVVDALQEAADRKILEITKDTATEYSAMAIPYDASPIIVATSYAFQVVDWSRVDYIAVISADGLLAQPDFRASENLLYDVVRLRNAVGRIDIQTHSPEHALWQAAAEQFPQQWLESELAVRSAMQLPPFADVVQIQNTDTGEVRPLTEADSALDNPHWVIDREQ